MNGCSFTDEDNPFPFSDEDFQGNPLNLAESTPSTISAVFALFTKRRNIKTTDRYIDLGCGDGRFVFAAAAMDIFAVGIDLEPSNYKKCEEEKARLGLTDSQCMFYLADIHAFDLSSYTLISCYLVDGFLQEIASKILERLHSLKDDALFATVLYKPRKWADPVGRDDVFCISLYDKDSSLAIKE
jgi:SAM-dependent methyltransferase